MTTPISKESRRKFREWLREANGKAWIRARLQARYLCDQEGK